MPRRAAYKNTRWVRILAWTAGSLVVLILAGLLIGQTWLNRYLRSPEFRDVLEEKTGRNMRAAVEITPIRFGGAEFSCENFTAKGAKDASFSLAKVEDVRGEVSLPSIIGVIFGERKFRVPMVEVQRLTLEFFERDRIDLDLPEKEPRENRSVIENLHIRDVRLAWGGGGLTGASIHASPVDGGWQINGEGGRLVQLGVPPVDVVNARIVRKEKTVFIQEANLRQNGGELSGSGEIVSDDKADLLIKVKNVSVTPYLTEDWRAKLHGSLAGEIRVRVPLNGSNDRDPKIEGDLKLERAVIEALPILNKIAEYLKTERFRRVELSQASAKVHFDAMGLRVEDLVLESKQLIALRGGFTYVNGIVDGTFELGVTPAPLQWLPGSTEKVFTVQRDGYVWAPMKVTGPREALKEDLSSRLVAAAGTAVVEKVEKTATDAVDSAVGSAKKGAEGVLNLLFGN